MSNCLFLFHRDLRLHDNTGLVQAYKDFESVIPCFIFDERQVHNNGYKSDAAITFMKECLQDLDNQLKKNNSKLHIYEGVSHQILPDIIKKHHLKALYANKDYTPFARKRDQSINEVCKKHRVVCKTFDDALLHRPGTVTKNDNTAYTIYTPFMRRAKMLEVPKPSNHFPLNNKNKSNLTQYTNYQSERDIPSLGKTTELSKHLKFGTISPRHLYHEIKGQLGAEHGLINQLYWRDFWYHIAYFYPHVFGSPFHKKYQNIKWNHDTKKFKKWCEGQTGFPIVDAGMRELNQTGFMHNRLRMITSSFLIKDLHIDWQWGEKYFAQKLVDYDPCINNGNWQWAASTGCDAVPYFRIFNPWRQQTRFDPECLYIKHWIPELQQIPIKHIHTWYDYQIKASYPAPMVDHTVEVAITKEMYKKSTRW